MNLNKMCSLLPLDNVSLNVTLKALGCSPDVEVGHEQVVVLVFRAQRECDNDVVGELEHEERLVPLVQREPDHDIGGLRLQSSYCGWT